VAAKKKSSRSKSSGRWLKAHFADPYVKQAQQQGYRSRAAYKLLEIQQKDHVLKHGMTVLDLGASPGGWSQVASRIIGPTGRIVAVDILPMNPIAHVEFIQGDFTERSVYDTILSLTSDQKVQLVMSDMAPNISGIKAVDQPKSMYLAELAFEMAQNVLQDRGGLLVKIFQGSGFDSYIKMLRDNFEKVVSRKPNASRANSREVYLLARGFHRK